MSIIHWCDVLLLVYTTWISWPAAPLSSAREFRSDRCGPVGLNRTITSLLILVSTYVSKFRWDALTKRHTDDKKNRGHLNILSRGQATLILNLPLPLASLQKTFHGAVLGDPFISGPTWTTQNFAYVEIQSISTWIIVGVPTGTKLNFGIFVLQLVY